jgi:predicted SAM-dependent methyltransferase
MDAAGTSAVHLRSRRRVDPRALVPNGEVKVNLGSGLEVAPGWINVDASLNALIAGWPRWMQAGLFRLSGYNALVDRDEYLRRLGSNTFVHGDLTRDLPFVNASVDFVFCSHVLEHLSRQQSIHLLQEAHRILQSSGVIRVGVPDLERAVDLYRAGNAREMLDRYFFRSDAGRLAQHRYLYDFPLLEEALREAGFSHVERREFREGAVPDLVQLDNRPEQTLFVEAAKE